MPINKPMTELECAIAVANGSLPSPYKSSMNEDAVFIDLKFTGSGVMDRPDAGGETLRPLELYTNPDTMSMIQSAPLVFRDDDKQPHMVDGEWAEDYTKAAAGTCLYVYHKDDEIRAVYKIFAPEAIKALLEEGYSTSPSVSAPSEVVDGVKTEKYVKQVLELAIVPKGRWDDRGNPSVRIDEGTYKMKDAESDKEFYDDALTNKEKKERLILSIGAIKTDIENKRRQLHAIPSMNLTAKQKQLEDDLMYYIEKLTKELKEKEKEVKNFKDGDTEMADNKEQFDDAMPEREKILKRMKKAMAKNGLEGINTLIQQIKGKKSVYGEHAVNATLKIMSSLLKEASSVKRDADISEMFNDGDETMADNNEEVRLSDAEVDKILADGETYLDSLPKNEDDDTEYKDAIRDAEMEELKDAMAKRDAEIEELKADKAKRDAEAEEAQTAKKDNESNPTIEEVVKADAEMAEKMEDNVTVLKDAAAHEISANPLAHAKKVIRVYAGKLGATNVNADGIKGRKDFNDAMNILRDAVPTYVEKRKTAGGVLQKRTEVNQYGQRSDIITGIDEYYARTSQGLVWGATINNFN